MMTGLLTRMRRYLWLIAAVALLIVLGLVIAFASGGNGKPKAAAVATLVSATPPPPSGEQVAVNGAVNRFVNAIDAGDADALYALQTEAYKQGCSRQDFSAVAQSLKRQRLAGPVTASILGDRALARLFDASGQPATLSLERAADGTWRVVATVSGRCS